VLPWPLIERKKIQIFAKPVFSRTTFQYTMPICRGTDISTWLTLMGPAIEMNSVAKLGVSASVAHVDREIRQLS
jgi:hypothetical protein